MLKLQKPSAETIRRFLDERTDVAFSYADLGATRHRPPSGFVVDHTRVAIGQGQQDFLAARAALQRWDQFRIGWVQAEPVETPIEEGQMIAVVAQLMGVWWINACRIVYAIDGPEDAQRFGFAYGTLPEHVGKGEERFTVEIDAGGTVWYDILAFSRPQAWVAVLAYPVLRWMQKRFGRQSAARMQALVRQSRQLQQGEACDPDAQSRSGGAAGGR